MTRLILDTSAYAAFMRGLESAKHALQHADEICLNPIVLGELKAGFRRGGRRQKNEGELARFLASDRVRVLSIDEETAERYAVIVEALRRAGTPIPSNAIWIAATAMQYGLRVLTADSHYLKVSQVIVDYLAA
jgi:predicted nucleic acid-binding protein